MNTDSITVNDVLQRTLFRNARVVGGKNGINRRLRWVHVLENLNIDKTMFRGGEMILTSGVGFQSEATLLVAYLQKLMEFNVVCLCIELGQYIQTIPDEMIEWANRYHFPLIVFTEKVRFVDISHDINSLLINRHYEKLQDLERVSREFHRMTLTSQGINKVLKLLYNFTNVQVLYLPIHGHPIFVPSLQANNQQELLDFCRERLNDLTALIPDQPTYQCKFKDKTLLFQPVGAMGQTWAYIVLISDHEPNQYEYKVVDSASISISQDLLRKQYIEERKLLAENVWVDDLVHNRIKNEDEFRSILGSSYLKHRKTPYHVCVIEIDHKDDLDHKTSAEAIETSQFHFSLLLRFTFEKNDFLPLITMKKNRIVVVALSLISPLPLKERLQRVFDSIQKINEVDLKTGALQYRMGVGQSYIDLKKAYLSYQEAINAVSLYSFYKKPIIYYDEIGVLQLLTNLRERKALESFINSYLGPLIEEDQSKGSKLLYTLKFYLDFNGSKQLAAQHLFIVRQSLYYRLEKIRELIGEDFMSSEKRLALQVALLGYQLLHPDIFSATPGGSESF
ncbi:PucR family transcriptional regulator [Brevibacillus fluminis]|uniref:PucR family transcriptional regulator n=1 Tax=Brevibacillus fluminis TaxID=511487 RepID=A0A3M8CZP5_9BACL|nr:PucR family transcriptional regulator [Brevibacillus fluminis]RNB81284.1 PucR family transcriptional regulator [Brevibacillus fluminis]